MNSMLFQEILRKTLLSSFTFLLVDTNTIFKVFKYIFTCNAICYSFLQYLNRINVQYLHL